MRSGCVRPTSPFVYIAKLQHLRMAIIRWRVFLRKNINSAPLTCAPRMGKSMGTMGWCMSFDTCESKSCTHSVPFPRFGIFGTVVLLILYFISCCRFLFKLLIISLLEGRGCVPVPVVPVVPINVWSLRFLFFLYITI